MCTLPLGVNETNWSLPPWLSLQGAAKVWLQQMGPTVRGAGEGAKT